MRKNRKKQRAFRRKLYVLGAILVVAVGWQALKPISGADGEIGFTLSSPLQECGDIAGNVAGIHSPLPVSTTPALIERITQNGRVARLITRMEQAKKSWLATFSTQRTHTVRLKYTVAPGTDGREIQNISLTLPLRFHENAEYELSCRSASGNEFVYRRLSPALHNQNYDEPPVSLLPRECTGASGEVIVLGADYSDAGDIMDEFTSAVFRATLWNPAARVVDSADLELFLPKVSYHPGESITVHAHAADEASPATLEVIRVGKETVVWNRIDNLRVQRQQISSYSFRDGVDWPAAATVALPPDMATGYYVAVLRQNDKRAAFPFVVTPAAENKAGIAIIAATNTWHAYNAWGGGSFYKNPLGKACLDTNYSPLISTRRPTNQPFPLDPATNGDHLFRAEKQIAEWLETNAIDYAVYTEDDLHADPELLKDHAVVLLPSHPEYYTKEMYDGLDRHVQRGGHILYLGGNGLYYRVTKSGERIEKYTNGQRHDDDGAFGGFWSAHLARSPAALLGVDADARDYDTHAPYVVRQADHPAFAGTGLKNGDSFAADGSGHELDVMTEKSPANTVLLAKGANPHGYGADMVLIETPSGGKVFSASSISFSYALVRDEKLGILVKNVIKMMQEPAANAPQHP